jgi:drug/metabolite transporter (DMT)-like permease
MKSAPVSRRPLDTTAVSTMVLLTFLWGFTHVATKLAAHEVSFVMQAGIRSIIAAVLLMAWARVRGVPLFGRDGTWWPGLVAGALFAGEFFFIYAGLEHTGASRMALFVYLAPVLTAIGVHLFVPGERLERVQWVGIGVAFAGIVVAFGEGFLADSSSLLGDAFGIVAAFMWAATTVVIRTTTLSDASASKTLFYQLAISALLLPLASLAMGERGVIDFGWVAASSLFYQGAVVSFASYLAWFWLLKRYLAGRLSVFSFLAPLFGVITGVLILGEPLRPPFVFAVALVGLGIYLVNRPAATTPEAATRGT